MDYGRCGEARREEGGGKAGVVLGHETVERKGGDGALDPGASWS